MTDIIAHTVCIDGHHNQVPSIVVDPDGTAFFGSDYDFCLTCGQPNDRSLAHWTGGTTHMTNDKPTTQYCGTDGECLTFCICEGDDMTETTSFDDATTTDLFNELANLVGLDDLLGTRVTDTQIKLGRSQTIAIIKRLSALENTVARLQPPF